MSEIDKIACGADFIVNGYSFTKENGRIRVLNLNKPSCATVLSETGEMLETSMDDIELSIVFKYFRKNRMFMEDSNAEIL